MGAAYLYACRDREVGDVCVCAHRLRFCFQRGLHGWDVHTGSGGMGFGGLLCLPGQDLHDGVCGSQGSQARGHGCPISPKVGEEWVGLLGCPVQQEEWPLGRDTCLHVISSCASSCKRPRTQKAPCVLTLPLSMATWQSP